MTRLSLLLLADLSVRTTGALTLARGLFPQARALILLAVAVLGGCAGAEPIRGREAVQSATRFKKPCFAVVEVLLVEDGAEDALCHGQWDDGSPMVPHADIGGCSMKPNLIITPENRDVLFSEMEHVWDGLCHDPGWTGKVIHARKRL